MPKSSNQKLKLLYLRRILLEETDDTHHLNAEQLVSRLEQLGINADRKTIYADVAALQDYGMDIFLQRGPGGGYSVSSRECTGTHTQSVFGNLHKKQLAYTLSVVYNYKQGSNPINKRPCDRQG